MFTDKVTAEVKRRLEELFAVCGAKRTEIEEGMAACTPAQREAVRFLYASMPLSDCLNYSFDVFLDYASHGVFLWENSAWKDKVGEGLFLDYVLHYRINEEDISPCRGFFYSRLKDRIEGLSMKEAALAVNYWCAGEASYQSTDERSVSPMTVYRSGFGRCGEESTFTVSALRSVGIPARQVYAPRWSHCDDNHAWVEVWCDGEWYFMGACEPEEVLNKGWFPGAASRAMLIHSRGFFRMEGQPETGGEWIGRDGMVCLYNELPRYADTARFKVRVLTPEGRPAEHARVDFEVLNYAENVPIASIWTDGRGEASVTLGLGSIHVLAVYKGLCAGRTAQVGEEACVTLELGETPGEAPWVWKDFDMVPPRDSLIHPGRLTPEQKLAGQEKLREVTIHRKQKLSAWEKEAENYRIPEDCADRDGMKEILRAARGNLGEILKFMAGESGKTLRMKEKLLHTVTAKDYRDVKAGVLQEHFESAMRYADTMDETLFVRYVLNPRIGLEPLSAYRKTIEKYLEEGHRERFRREPALLWREVIAWIREYPQMDYGALVTLPGACLASGTGSLRSKKLLCVAALRTLGIAARLSDMDGSMEYYRDGVWIKLLEEDRTTSRLKLTGEGGAVFRSRQNYSLARLGPEGYHTLDLPDADRENLCLAPGCYRLITANRLPNGSQFAKECAFCLKEGQAGEARLSLREAGLADMLERIELPEFFFEDERGNRTASGRFMGRGKSVLLWLEEGKEPTEHILNELYGKRAEFNGADVPLRFFIRSREALRDATLSRTLPVLAHTEIYYDSFRENISLLGRRMYVDPEKLPLILVIKDGYGVYAQSGYNVGTADMLMRILMFHENVEP